MSGTIAAIPASQIVSVTPSVLSAGGNGLDLVGLILSRNTRTPIGQILTFPDAASVMDYYGEVAGNDTTPLPDLASTYFLGFDNSNIKPGSLLIARYNINPAGAWARGGALGMTLSQLQAIPAGTLTVVIDGTSHTSTSINFAPATSFSAAGQIMASAMSGLTGPQTASFTGAITGTTLTVTNMSPGGSIQIGDQLSGTNVATTTNIVSYGPGTTGGNGTYTIDTTNPGIAAEPMTTKTPVIYYDSIADAFVTVSATTGATSTITLPTGAIAAATHMDAAGGGITSQGAAPQSPGPFMDWVVSTTADWCSFMTSFDPDQGTGYATKEQFAAWVNAQDVNYLYVAWDSTIAATQANADCLGNALQNNDNSGTCVVYSPAQGPTVASFVMGVVASIDFTEFDGRTTLAFRQQTGLAPDVVSGSVAKSLETNGYVYYGAWKTRNQRFTFAYPGNVTGPFAWVDSYINSIWLTNAFQLALMQLLVNTKSIPYNDRGYTMIKAGCMDVIGQAGDFGVFRTGVILSAAEAAEVNASAGVKIDTVLFAQGYYLQVRNALPQVRAQRGSPPITFWYTDGQSVQRLHLASINVQ